jgi:hypothetical protein
MITPEQAKEILSIARPDRAGPEEADVREALRLVELDPGLRRWWEAHQHLEATVRTALQSIPVPAQLAERILAGRPPATRRLPLPLPRPRRWLWGLAAAAVFALAAWLFWSSLPAAPRFPVYRDRMARAALRDYRMDFQTNDLAAVQRYLAQRGAPAGYALSPSLRALPGLGCGVLRWQDQPVSMICFDRGEGQLLWLFVTEQRAVAGAPAGREPVFASVGRLVTAAWSEGSLFYLLATVGEEPALKRYL